MNNINKKISDIIDPKLSPFKYINNNHQNLIYPKFILHKLDNILLSKIMDPIINSILPLNILSYHLFLKLIRTHLDDRRKNKTNLVDFQFKFTELQNNTFDGLIRSLFKYRHNPYESIDSICKKIVN